MANLGVKISCWVGILGLLAGCASTSDKKTLSAEEQADFYLQIANGALYEGDPTGALQALIKAEELNPKLPELYHSRSLALLAKGDADGALAAVRKALQMKPNYASACSTMGKLLIDRGKYDEAAKYLSLAAEDHLYRDSHKPLTSLGIIAYRRNQFDTAKKYFDRAILAAPQRACVAYYYRGHLALKKSDYRNATLDYTSATKKSCTGFVDAQMALGLTYEHSGAFDKARKQYLSIQDNFPKSPAAEQAVIRLRNLP